MPSYAFEFSLNTLQKFRRLQNKGGTQFSDTNFAVLTRRRTDYRVSRFVLCSSAFFIRATILKLAVGGRRTNRVGFVAVAVSVRAAKRMVMSAWTGVEDENLKKRRKDKTWGGKGDTRWRKSRHANLIHDEGDAHRPLRGVRGFTVNATL